MSATHTPNVRHHKMANQPKQCFTHNVEHFCEWFICLFKLNVWHAQIPRLSGADVQQTAKCWNQPWRAPGLQSGMSKIMLAKAWGNPGSPKSLGLPQGGCQQSTLNPTLNMGFKVLRKGSPCIRPRAVWGWSWQSAVCYPWPWTAPGPRLTSSPIPM